LDSIEWTKVEDSGKKVGWAPDRRDTSPNPNWKRGYDFDETGGKVYGENVKFHCFSDGYKMITEELVDAAYDLCDEALSDERARRNANAVNGWLLAVDWSHADIHRTQVALLMEL
jgi:hypothetical protein